MSQWINFIEIRQKVSLRDVIYQLYRIDTLTADGDKLVGACPVHGGDSPRAFHADLSKNIWHCFSRCKGGGNQLDFVAAKEGISIRDAALKLQAFFLTGSNELERQAPPATLPSLPSQAKTSTEGKEKAANQPLKVKLELKSDHPHLIENRGLKLQTIKHFGVGYCSRGIMRGCIAFPIHNESGVLVAYAGRRLKPQQIRQRGKYKLPKGFKKELVLFNYHRAKEAMADRGLILVEGFFSVLQLHQLGFSNVVASMGCEVSESQAELLSAAKEVVILFDGNQAGQSATETLRARLELLVTTSAQ